MPRNHFLFRKENQLKKSDKSIKQNWDEKIISLCSLINKRKEYYTTSSCSGRVLLLKQSKEKRDDLFIKVWHDKINFDELKNELNKIKTKELVYFKQEPCILHVSCSSLEKAQEIHDLAKLAGWKRCGIIATKKRIVVELNATEKLEFPIFYKGRVLVDDNFLKLVVSEANKKLGSSWGKIINLEKGL
ncbi:MAG: hypothetical protein WC533_02125 [Candidatus Pacearchaeota archaeon]